MAMPSVPELLVILAIIVLLFGAKKIPDLAKGLGSGIKNFKKAVKDDGEDSTAETKEIDNNQTAKTTATKQERAEKV